MLNCFDGIILLPINSQLCVHYERPMHKVLHTPPTSLSVFLHTQTQQSTDII